MSTCAKGGRGRGHTLEIKQKDKQFSPQTAVVLKRTNVVFPNMDSSSTTSFSTSGRNSFDLGSYRSGDTAALGGADHTGRRRGLLQHPLEDASEHPGRSGGLYTKVGARRQLPHRERPRRRRRIVAWSPNAKPAQQKIEVGFERRASQLHAGYRRRAKAHTNKLGQAHTGPTKNSCN
jgi:hypothetical protein